jgi:hypothetical protein
MYGMVRSCKYCADNNRCDYRKTVQEVFKTLRLEATAVINCKRVRPYYEIGDPIVFLAWKGTGEVPEDDKEAICGTLVDLLKDRNGHARTYVVKVPRYNSEYFVDGDNRYWLDPSEALKQYPESELTSNEILVFVKYMNIQRKDEVE